jgi:hypothetical protein
LSTALSDLFDRVDKIQRESTKRLKGGEGAIEAGVVAMLFERSNGNGGAANADGAAPARQKAGARG